MDQHVSLNSFSTQKRETPRTVFIGCIWLLTFCKVSITKDVHWLCKVCVKLWPRLFYKVSNLEQEFRDRHSSWLISFQESLPHALNLWADFRMLDSTYCCRRWVYRPIYRFTRSRMSKRENKLISSINLLAAANCDWDFSLLQIRLEHNLQQVDWNPH